MGRPPKPHRGMAISTREDYLFEGTIPGGLGVRQKMRLDKAHENAYPTKCGYNDPLSVQLLLLALANIDPAVQIRAGDLRDWLQNGFPQIIWDSVTVGRVLATISERFEDVFGLGKGFLGRTRDGRGTIYYINDHPAVADLVIRVIEALERLVTLERDRMLAGQPQQRTDSPLNQVRELRRDVE